MYPECMVDIETLSTEPNAVVLSIGAVLFALDGYDTYETLEEDGRCFFAILDINSQIDLGRHVSGDTILWWMKQGRMAQQETFREAGRVPVETVLEQLWPQIEPRNMWGNGSNFDNVIINTLYRDYGYEQPPFWKAKDLRTIKYLAHDKAADHIERGVEHSAIDDAKYQVLCAQAYWRSLHEYDGI